jgi:glycosyltransferase involved in cell wall biosynthesis
VKQSSSIVVLTPLRNDGWILRRFLSVVSTFADRIIIADQGSIDDGLAICREFSKVTVVENSSTEFNEASRQQLLIAAARDLVPLPRILIALDADEIVAANAPSSEGWQRMLSAPPGTLVHCEMPDFDLSLEMVRRGRPNFPVAFIDDGSPHRPLPIHSPRLPTGDGRPPLVLDDVKSRMYAALENVMGTKSWYWRRRYYWSRRVLAARGAVQPTPREWLAGWEERGIEMTQIEDVQPYWQDLTTLDLLLEHGSLRFWLDDIWEKDWIGVMEKQQRSGRIVPPPRLFRFALDAAQALLEAAAATRRRWSVSS